MSALTSELDSAANEATIAVSPAGRVTLWSAGAAELTGVPTDDAIGEPLTALTGCYESLLETVRDRPWATGDVWVLTHAANTALGRRYLRTTGSSAIDPRGDEELILHSRLAVAPAPGEAGPLHYASLGTRSELAARASGRMVIEGISAGVARAYNYLHRDLIGRTSIEFVHPDDRGEWARAWEAMLLAPGSTSSAVVRRRTGRDDGWRILETRITNLLGDRAVGAVVIDSQDVTERRRTDLALVAAEQTLRSVLESSVEGVWVIDAEGETVFANALMADLLGVHHARMSELSIGDFWSGGLTSVLLHRVPGMRSGYQVPLRRDGSPVRWLLVNAVPRHDRSGGYAGAILLCRDITGERSRVPGIGTDLRLVGASGASGGVSPDDGEPPSPHAARIMDRYGLHGRASALRVYGLSDREADIAARLLRGDRVPAIAAALFVSQSTVRNQLASTFRKVGVHSQQELIAHLRDRQSD